MGAPSAAAQPSARGLAGGLRARSRRSAARCSSRTSIAPSSRARSPRCGAGCATELSLAKAGAFDIKQDPGGIADIEFLVDYWVLAHSAQYPELVEFPDNIRQLEALERVGLVPEERCLRLKEAYLALRQRVHELALDEGGRVVPEPRASRRPRASSAASGTRCSETWKANRAVAAGIIAASSARRASGAATSRQRAGELDDGERRARLRRHARRPAAALPVARACICGTPIRRSICPSKPPARRSALTAARRIAWSRAKRR